MSDKPSAHLLIIAKEGGNWKLERRKGLMVKY